MRILEEQDSFAIINKPPGIVVNRADTVKTETVQDWSERHFGIERTPPADATAVDFYLRAGIVHRLDKETSGCLVIAKTPEAFLRIQEQFKDRIVHKTYLALAHGSVPVSGEVRATVGRLPWNRERFGVLPGGRESVTRYTTIRSDIPYRSPLDRKGTPTEVMSLVQLHPETGRTHQIRIHLKYIGHPIVGDFLYAGRKTSRRDRAFVPRVMLHAWKLSFLHPFSGERLEITSPIPDDMSTVMGGIIPESL